MALPWFNGPESDTMNQLLAEVVEEVSDELKIPMLGVDSVIVIDVSQYGLLEASLAYFLSAE